MLWILPSEKHSHMTCEFRDEYLFFSDGSWKFRVEEFGKWEVILHGKQKESEQLQAMAVNTSIAASYMWK